MAAVLRIDIVGNARSAQAAIAQTDSSFSKLSGTASRMGTALKLGAAAGGAAILALGKSAYDSASELQQSFGAVESVFGKSADSIKRLANDAADNVGLAKSQYGNLAALLGSQLTNMGRSQEQAAKQTSNLIGLGADLAATYGGTAADAVSALSSVLKGETDPIERYGISIKQSDINARLAAEGQDKLSGTALKAATASAALALVAEQSKSSVGAFGRESDTAAGQQQRFAANLENTKAKLGTALLPVMTTAFEFLNTRAFPAVAQLSAEMSERFGPTIQRVGVFIQDRLVPAAREMFTWFMERIYPNIRSAVIPIFNQARALFGGVADTLDKNSGNLQKLGNFIKFVMEKASDFLPILSKVMVTQMKVAGQTIDIVVTSISTLVGWIDTAIQKIKDIGSAIANSPLGKLGGAIGGGLGAINGLFGIGALAGRRAGTIGAPAIGGRLGGLATAAAGGGGGFAGYTRAAAAGGGGLAYVDARRTVNLTVTGALDPPSVAEQIRRLLREDDLRAGRATSYAPATGWAG